MRWFFFLWCLFGLTASDNSWGRCHGNLWYVGHSLVLGICSSNIIRVFRTNITQGNSCQAVSHKTSLATQEGFCVDPVDVKFSSTSAFLEISTGELKVFVELPDESHRVLFYSIDLKMTLTREIKSVVDFDGSVTQEWYSDNNESIYGMGQYVNGELNYRAAPLQLIQYNTEAVVPFFVSTRQYGILWDNYAWGMFNSPENELDVNSTSFVPRESGTYWFYVVDVSAVWDTGEFTLSLTDSISKTIHTCEHKLHNMPNSVSCKFKKLEAKRSYIVSFSQSRMRAPKVFYNSMETYLKTSLHAKSGNVIDYYFVHGKTVDGTIKGYRIISGTAFMLPRWAYGFWQCKERYHTQEELLESARQFRNRSIPVDNIVQDWQYWGKLGWGPHWDKSLYPDPRGMIEQLHALKYHFMVSVWSFFDTKTEFHEIMHSKDFLIPGSLYFDPWNPAARSMFFNFSNENHFKIGVDALWLDATEPESLQNINKTIFLGNGNDYLNSYSLMVAQAISEGKKSIDLNPRDFSLTRSSSAGQQRYGAVLWSGDIDGSWDSLRRQISMSINYQLSGNPYWSMDIDGFFRPADQYTSDAYHLLLIRWFQFGMFVPLFRVHGTGSNTEIWNYGDDTANTIKNDIIRFRYRLLPYIYSGFHDVEQSHYSMQRGMVFDFADDREVWDVADQFMFGYSFLVAPLFSQDSFRNVYLPKITGVWRDFFTGDEIPYGWHVSNNCSRATFPLFVRSSILVLGPFVQTTAEIITSLEVRVYTGANSKFTYYFDDESNRGSGYMDVTWNESISVLTLGMSQGDLRFPTISIDVVVVDTNRGTGIAPSRNPNSKITYTGSETKWKMPDISGII